MKKSWILILSIVLAAALSIGSTVAYLQDADSDVNVMTLGKVDIVQVEEERSGDELVKFDNYNKTLFPGVYSEVEPVIGTDGYYAAQNAIDKIVSVDNEGKSDAYVRTIFAFEQGTMTDARFEELMNINKNESSDWTWTKIGNGQTIGAKPGVYTVYVAVYNEILPKGESTSESLKQVLLAKEGTNEDVKALDANGNQMYEILVLSQAVQSMGFESMGAAEALDEAFGGVKENLGKWMGGMEAEGPTAGSALDLQRTVAAMSANGGAQTVTLTEDITLNSALTLEKGSLTINLGGHTLTLSDAATSGWNPLYSTAKAGSGWGFSVGKNATLTITGSGNVKGNGLSSLFSVLGALNLNVTGSIGGADYVVDIQGGKVSVQSGSFAYNKDLSVGSGDTENGALDISGGVFNGVPYAVTVTNETELQAVVAKANNGETVSAKLGADITLESAMAVTAGDMTLDLNGNDLTFPKIRVGKGVKLTIIGTGNLTSFTDEVFSINGCMLNLNVTGIVASMDTENGMFFWPNGDEESIVTIQNGNYQATGVAYGGNMTVNIMGGTFNVTRDKLDREVETSRYFVEQGWYNSVIKFNVTGGTFAEEPALSITDYAGLKAAFDKASQGNDVKAQLDADLAVHAADMVSDSDDWNEWNKNHLILKNGSLTLDLNNHNLTMAEESNSDGFINVLGGSLTIKGTGNIDSYHSWMFYNTSGTLTLDVNGEVSSDRKMFETITSTITIKNGTYFSEGNMFSQQDGCATINITGGEFKKTRAEIENELTSLNWNDETAFVYTIADGVKFAE